MTLPSENTSSRAEYLTARGACRADDSTVPALSPAAVFDVRVSRRTVAVLAGSMSAVAAAVQLPVLAAIFAIVLGAATLMPAAPVGRLSRLNALVAWLPVGAVGVATAGLVVAMAAGVTGLSVWSTRWSATLAWALLAAAFSAVAWRRGGTIQVMSAGVVVYAVLPAVFLVLWAVKLLQPLEAWSRTGWMSTDTVNHVEMLVDVWRNGSLNYFTPVSFAELNSAPSLSPYPRGLHAVLAWLLGVADPSTGYAAWEAGLYAAAWVQGIFFALLAVAIGSVTWFAARRLGVRRPGAALLVAGGQLLMLAQEWTWNLLWSGFLTTAFLAVILAAIPIGLSRPGALRENSGWTAAGLIAAVALTANVWQLFVPALLPMVAIAVGYWWTSGRPQRWAVVVAAVGGAAACVPVGWVSVFHLGLGHAQTEGGFYSFALWEQGVVVSAAVTVLWAGRHRASPGWLPWSVGIVATVGLGLALLAWVGWDDLGGLPYYPGKVLWHASVWAFPAALCAVGVGLGFVWRSSLLKRATRGSAWVKSAVIGAVIVVIGVLPAGSAATSTQLSVQSLVSNPGMTVQVPLLPLQETYPDGALVVPWLLHPQGWHPSLRYTDWHASQALRSQGYRIVDDPFMLIEHRRSAMCDWLGEHPDAFLVTGPQLGYQELLDTGCPEEVVRPNDWTVLVSPSEWWDGTQFERTGGLPDPAFALFVLESGPMGEDEQFREDGEAEAEARR